MGGAIGGTLQVWAVWLEKKETAMCIITFKTDDGLPEGSWADEGSNVESNLNDKIPEYLFNHIYILYFYI